MAKSKPRLYIRKFLNKPGHHTIASVLCSVERGANVFVLADCDRTIKLDFSGYRKDSRKNALYKVDALINVLTQFQEAMTEEFKDSSPEDDY